MLLLSALFFVTILIQFSTGAIALVANHKHWINRSLFLFVLFNVAWLISVNAIASPALSESVWFGRLVFLFGLLTLCGVTFFTQHISQRTKSPWIRLFYVYSLFVAGLLFTPFIIQDVGTVTAYLGNLPIPKYGVLFPLYTLAIIWSLAIIAYLLVAEYKQSVGNHKQRIKIIILGVTSFVGFSLFTNLILPTITGDPSSFLLAPIGTIFMAVSFTYAIIKHRFLDIRLIVARSVAYFISIAVIASVYATIIFGVVEQFFPGTYIAAGQQAIYIGAAIGLALTFQPLKRFFDKTTDRLFYRDRYETEDVLNRLGKVFVAKSNSFELLEDSLTIITHTLKTRSGAIVVVDEGDIYETASTENTSGTDISLEMLQKFDEQLTIYDEVQENEKLHKAFRELNAYAVLRLKVQDELVGYLVLSEKQTGSIFTQQDVNLLEILAQEMAVAIQNVKSYQKIANFSQTLQREVEEATTQLRESNQRLRELDEAKDEFISMASHQLRTPLTTIKGYLSMLLDGDAGELNESQKQFVDQAYVGSQRMVYLISDMLNVSRISTGKLTIDKKLFDLVEVVKSEVDQLQQQAGARDVQLSFHPSEEEIWLTLDEGKIRQVAMNFIDNAIYYAPKGSVDVYLEKTENSVEFRVVDNGIGVSEEAQEQLFTKFFRADNARHMRPDGTGLGLYMAKQVIEAQGGEILFESTEGEGSMFGFRFPLENQKVDQ